MKTYIRQKAKSLIKKYGTDNPEELADYLGIMIVNMDLGKVAGSYRLLHRKKVIFVNSKLGYHHQKVVIAHELGHALLHPKMNCYFIKNKTSLLTSKVEREANIFACEILVNDDILGEYIDQSIQDIAKAEYLPVELLELKFS